MYGKKEAKMTRGLAIFMMLVLHLFCRIGEDVYGTPLIWVNETTPLVFYFGFFAEICVPLYTLCAGYAQQVMIKQGSLAGWKGNLKRAWKLLVNYWVVLVLFSGLGLILPSDGSMPGSLSRFMKNLILIDSYNGAWWYLKTYIILMLIPPVVLLFPVCKMKPIPGILCCLILQSTFYIAEKFGYFSAQPFTQPGLAFFWKEGKNLLSVLPYFWAGAFLCKGNVVDSADSLLERVVPQCRNVALLGLFVVLFLGVSIAHKAVLMPTVAVIVFLLFNLWRKGTVIEKTFLFLGKHSTNVWLTHMFFYLCVFQGFAQKAQYPIAIFTVLLSCSVFASYAVEGIKSALWTLFGRNK